MQLPFFSKIFSKFQLTKGDTSIVGIDIGSSAIKVVQARSVKGKMTLETYGAISLGPYAGQEAGKAISLNAEAIGKALKDLFKEANVTTKRARLAIPSSASLIFLLELPEKVEEKELVTVVPTEARRYVPVPITEVSLDWWVIPDRGPTFGNDDAGLQVAKKEKGTEVLVAAINNDVVTSFKEIVKIAGLDSEGLEIEMFSTLRSSLGRILETTVLIDIGANKTKVAIIDRGIIQDFHIITKGSQDITSAMASSLGITFKEAEKIKFEHGLDLPPEYEKVKPVIEVSLEYIMSEIKTLLVGYEKKKQEDIDKVVFAGGGSMMKGLVEHSGKFLNLPFKRAESLSLLDAPAFLLPVLKDAGPEFSVASGLALRTEDE